MPGWLPMVLGMVGGLMLIAAAIYLVVRPYLRHDFMGKSDTGAPSGEDWLSPVITTGTSELSHAARTSGATDLCAAP